MALLVGLVIFSAVFSFYTGFSWVSAITGTRTFNQAVIGIENINTPPILRLPLGTVLVNSTYSVQVNGPYTVYMWWFQFQNNTLHPTNIWEPVYQYWYLSTPATASLYAVYVRAHFFSRLIYGGWTLDNGTRLIVTFSPIFYVPTIGNGVIASLLKPGGNVTVVTNVKPVLDPNAPYPTGPNAYALGAAPPDPWVVLNSPETVINGLSFGTLFGGPAGLAAWGLLQFIFNPADDKTLRQLRQYFVGTGVKRKDIPRLLQILEG